MKYNDYIILTDEDYNNMKTKYHLLDDIDKDSCSLFTTRCY